MRKNAQKCTKKAQKSTKKAQKSTKKTQKNTKIYHPCLRRAGAGEDSKARRYLGHEFLDSDVLDRITLK